MISDEVKQQPEDRTGQQLQHAAVKANTQEALCKYHHVFVRIIC
jgi:hypothetical protein